ncbi:peptidoglycan D,D-transpeptidase FtsI family protein [Vallitalea guaymasensis]|uniref:peptidoglycan D,D-transpeptidase FtsI family protein n=1 Tax=Vallitalea guaymasensis TaxID=1185412 RepID=UPI000DE30AE9|nr:penicillin-binding transpeptidase domain-containing protein [Vallitalea guaymasensis]
MKRKKEQVNRKDNKSLNNISYIFIGLFVILIVNIIKFVYVDSTNVVINSYNPRIEELEQNIVRGKILDTNKKVLAETMVDGDKSYRIYPYENIFSHIIGYSHQGKTGIEALVNYDLLKSNVGIIEKTVQSISKKKSVGDNVVTTLDADLQKKAYELLGNRKGAIVAIEPSTGKILCMVSKPDFNPNYIESNWTKLNNDEENSPLLNKATHGLYPPGSTFKIVTALAFIRENPGWKDYTYTCNGKDVFEGTTIHCYSNTKHGEENLEKAFKMSCNTAFAHIGTNLDMNNYRNVANDLLFDTLLPYPLHFRTSRFKLSEESAVKEIAETAIGQGETEVTPFHNALITAAIANGGILMKPYLIDSVENANGKLITKNLPEFYSELMSVEEAGIIKEFMKKVVSEGTGKTSAVQGIDVAGKTGSAEVSGKKPHAWYVGFAPADNPQIAVSVIVENSGTSTKYAAPIAKQLFELYINK